MRTSDLESLPRISPKHGRPAGRPFNSRFGFPNWFCCLFRWFPFKIDKISCVVDFCWLWLSKNDLVLDSSGRFVPKFSYLSFEPGSWRAYIFLSQWPDMLGLNMCRSRQANPTVPYWTIIAAEWYGIIHMHIPSGYVKIAIENGDL